MSELGQTRPWRPTLAMSGIPLKAEVRRMLCDVRSVPILLQKSAIGRARRLPRFLEAVGGRPAQLGGGVDVVSGPPTAVTRHGQRPLAVAVSAVWRADEGFGRWLPA